MNNEMPCTFCTKICSFIGMTHCDKLNIYLKIKYDKKEMV